jgi:hypothetical protein
MSRHSIRKRNGQLRGMGSIDSVKMANLQCDDEMSLEVGAPG